MVETRSARRAASTNVDADDATLPQARNGTAHKAPDSSDESSHSKRKYRKRSRRTSSMQAPVVANVPDGHLASDSQNFPESRSTPKLLNSATASSNSSSAKASTTTSGAYNSGTPVNLAIAAGNLQDSAPKSSCPLPPGPGSRFKKAHRRLHAQQESLGELFERREKRRDYFAKEAAGVFDRLATPKSAVRVPLRLRSFNQNAGFDFGDGREPMCLNFEQLPVSKAVQVHRQVDLKGEVGEGTYRENTMKRDVKSSRIPRIGTQSRREQAMEFRAAHRDKTIAERRGLVAISPYCLTMPSSSPLIERLSTPKSAARTKELRERARENRKFERYTGKLVYVNTTKLSDKQFSLATELGIIKRVEGMSTFSEENYANSLETAKNKRETTALQEMRARIEII